jgi:hypothetical protein
MITDDILFDIEPTSEYPRHTEGAFVTLENGELLFIYSRFTGRGDNAFAELVEMRSDDNGQSWSEAQVAVPNEGGLNVMSVSLLRLQDGRIALFYLVKNSMLDCRPVVRFSKGDAREWSEPQQIIEAVGYNVLNNDRVIQLKKGANAGRLIAPVSYKRPRANDPEFSGANDKRGIAIWHLSDDGGESWREAQTWWALPFNSGSGLQEPGVVELEDGNLFSWARTDQGRQYFFRSHDSGETWSPPQPSSLLSPLSPASIKRIPDSPGLLAVYNDHSGQFPLPPHRGRTPLVTAISSDGGTTWHDHKLIEDDPDGWYCYTAMHFVEDGVLLAYVAGDSEVGRLSRMRVRHVAYR